MLLHLLTAVFSLAMPKKRFFRAQSSHSTKNRSPEANAG